MIFPKTKGFLLSLCISVGLLGCHPLAYLSFAFPPSISVEQLQEKTEGTVIYLQGIVRNQAPFLDQGAYQLEDTTGKVWVITSHPLPKTGEQIALKGKVVYQSIPIAGQELGEFYLVELEKVGKVPETDTKPVVNPIPETKPLEIPGSTPPNPSPLPLDLFFPQK